MNATLLPTPADTNSDKFFNRRNRDFPVAKFAGTKYRHKHLRNVISIIVFYDHCNADFTGLFGIGNSPVLFDPRLLATRSFDLEDGNALDSFPRQCVLNLIELERFEDRLYPLHQAIQRSVISPVVARSESSLG